jgi:carbon monoxide dehydrogenase subunit G
MVDVERTFTVPRPVKVVVEYLQDFANAESWDPGTVTCTRVDDGPIEVGAKWHNVSEFRGRRTELAYQLTRLEPQHLTFLGENRTATSTDDLTFADVDGDTSITYHANIVFHGFAKLADPFLRREFEKLGDQVVTMMTESISALDS